MPTYKNIGKAIFNILSNDSAIAAAVGTRIFPNVSAPGVGFPFIIYSIDDTNPNNTKNGASITDEVQVQITTFSTTYSETTDISETIREALDYIAGGTYNGIIVQSISFSDEDDGFNDDILQRGVHTKTQTYRARLIFS